MTAFAPYMAPVWVFTPSLSRFQTGFPQPLPGEGTGFLFFQRVFHKILVRPPVGLDPVGINRGPFPLFSTRLCRNVLSAAFPISPPKASISRTRCPFPFRRWKGAGHIAHRVQVDRKNNGLTSEARGGKRRLNAAWPAPMTALS
jgi:hypothetical protein